MSKRVFIHSPYSAWGYHTAMEATLAHALRERGAEVRFILCDGLFRECDIFRRNTTGDASGHRPPNACSHCQALQSTHLATYALEWQWLGTWISRDRIARIEVLRQGPPGEDTAAGDAAAGDAAGGNAEPAATETTVRFTELDAEGGPIGPPKELTIPGTRLYVEGIVVKFGDEYVEEGDPLRGTSIYLLQRLFSEEMAPEDGLELDSVNQHPLPFTGDDLPDPLYRDLFQRVWDYANDPEAAERIGVRAIQAEAPSMEVRPGRTYRLELRQSGGMTLRAER